MIGLIELFGAVLLRPLRESREKTSAATTTVFEHAPVTTRLSGRRIWIDLDNSPHVPFFRPIISELKGRGCTLIITARDAYQVR